MSKFTFEEYRAFGWVIHRKLLNEGDTFRVDVAEAMPRNQVDNITYVTRGVLEDPMFNPPRLHTPGSWSLDQPPVPAGQFRFRALEPTTWWCINYVANRKQFPQVQAFSALEQTEFTVNANELVWLCEGQTNNITEPQELTPGLYLAKTNCYMLMFAQARVRT